jgi:hypothetical protein
MYLTRLEAMMNPAYMTEDISFVVIPSSVPVPLAEDERQDAKKIASTLIASTAMAFEQFLAQPKS